MASNPAEQEIPPDAGKADACPLTPRQQRRNLVLYAACVGLMYLTAPVSYVGVTQAALCHGLGASDKVANLPLTLYFAMTVVPVLMAWFVPYVSWLRRNLITCFGLYAASLAVAAGVLAAPVAPGWKVAVVVLQSALAGGVAPTATAFLWEVIGRGVSGSRRGLALALAFGAGPILAVISSLGSQLLLAGKLGPVSVPRIDLGPVSIPEVELGTVSVTAMDFPHNFASLFAAAAPLMAVGMLLCFGFVIPLPDREVSRQPFLSGVLGGMGNILTDPVLRTAAVVTILVYTGNNISSNMSLYVQSALDASPEKYAGVANALRFAFKAVAGLLLGWLLTRTNPRAGLLATASLFVASQLWALTVTGQWYLLAFGIFGAGELIGVYAPNYILSASPRADYRRNMAFVTMLMLPTSAAPYLFGAISDYYGRPYRTPLQAGSTLAGGGTPDTGTLSALAALVAGERGNYTPAVGYMVCFGVCAVVMTAGILLALFRLPARPRPGDRAAG